MKTVLRSALLVLVGIVIGALLTSRGEARQAADRGVRLNSVGLSVKNFDEAFAFYTKTFGFPEAFTLRDANGRPTMTFLQISKDTFLQLVPANANRPPGLSSILLEVADVQDAVRKLRGNGAELQDPRVSPNTKSTLTSVRDPEGNRVELLQMTPGSLIRAAMEAWK